MEGGTNSPDKMATVSDPCGHTDPAEDETISSTAPKSNHSGFLFSLLSQSDNKEKNTALTSEALASDTADNMPVNNMTADSGCSNSVENPFQINMSCIEAVPVNEQDSELQDLGLTVFDQEQFEQDVMAQVDQAFKLEEQQRLKKMLQKELQTVQDEIRGTKQELKPLEKVLQMSKAQAPSKEVQRRLVSIKQQKDNKQKQLKKLKAKEKKLVGQLNGEANLLEDDGDEDEGDSVKDLAEMLGIGVKSQETEMERKIRLGEMTPFGSMVTEQNKKKAQPGPSDQMSDFEKYLLDQGKKVKQGRIKHLKRNHSTSSLIDSQKSKKDSSNEPSLKKTKNGLHASPSAPMLSRGPNDGRRNSGIYKTTSSSEEKTNRFDEKDKRWYRPSEIDFSKWKIGRRKRRYPKLRHNFSEDPNLSDGEDDGEDCYYDDPDFAPDERELQNSWLEDTEICNDEPGVLEKRSKLQHQNHKGVSRSGKGLKVGIEQDDEEFDLGAIKSRFKGRKQSRDSPVGHIADDGNMKNYESRIKKWKNEKLQKKMERIESGYDVEEDGSNSEEDMEFDGGFKVPGEIWKRLYKYQRIGVKWLWELHNQQAGGIVGDEMGLGKTIQIIAFLAGLRYSQLPDRIEMTRYQGLGPTIIIVPATVMHQWVREFHTWWPPFRVAILHSSGSFTTSEESLVRSVVQNNGILITGFSTMLIKQELILQYDWHYVILDEGHKIRNPDAQITLACKQFRTSHRLILSGSPVQNNLKELWSLFDFVFPGKLGTLPDFMTHFSVPIVQGGYSNASQVQVQTAYKCACVLRDTINPYLLRRMKADVKNNLKLPNKNEQVLFCRLTDEQKEVYQEYLDSKECQMIISGNFMAFPGLITLRKISNHPDLSTGGPKEFGMIPEGYTEQSVAYGYWKRSGKMIVVESLLKLWKKQNHKVLLFSQSSQMLDILEKFVNDQGYTYLRMDGKTTISARQPVIQKFNTDPNLFLFLLTTRVGGLGVNLTGADRVLIYDPDWNPSTDTQARERAWRIGQKNQVTIYRLLTTGTIEEKIYHRQIFKQFLTNRVLKDPKQRRFFKSNDLYELFTLGDDNPKGSTETSAIFAGTGSDVKVKPSAQRPKDPTKLNRFDIKKSKEKSCEALGKIDKAQSAPSPIPTEDKLAKMREIARKLSEQIGQQKQDQEDTCSVKSEVEDGAREGNAPDTVNISTCSAGASSECGHGSSPVPGTSTDNPSELPSSPQASKDTTDSPQSSSKKGKHKKKSKKKAKDAVFEGQKIAHLDKLGSAKPEKPDKTPASLQDDYVLQKLFKKTGIHSAMQHDKIMMSSNPDYALVEGEADRVAKEAARALKASRSQCHRAATGIPTWTGSSGVVATSKSSKPRFGQKKNTKLLPSVKPAAGPDTTSPVKKKSVKEETTTSSKTRHFDGSSAGSQTLTKTLSSSSSVNMLSSDDLLARMRARNHLTVTLTEDGTESTLRTEIGSQDMELMADIRNYVAFQASMDGQATTQELLHKFADCLAAQDSAKFKAMLKQICDFSKRNDIGVWQLKPEFR